MTATEWVALALGGVALTVSAMAVAACWWESRSRRILERRGVATIARVVRVEQEPWSCLGRGVAARGIDWYAWLEFVDTSGVAHRIKTPGRLAEGDQVDVVYDPMKCERFRVAMPSGPSSAKA